MLSNIPQNYPLPTQSPAPILAGLDDMRRALRDDAYRLIKTLCQMTDPGDEGNMNPPIVPSWDGGGEACEDGLEAPRDEDEDTDTGGSGGDGAFSG